MWTISIGWFTKQNPAGFPPQPFLYCSQFTLVLYMNIIYINSMPKTYKKHKKTIRNPEKWAARIEAQRLGMKRFWKENKENKSVKTQD